MAAGSGDLEWRGLHLAYLQRVAAIDLTGGHSLVDALELCTAELLAEPERYPPAVSWLYGDHGRREQLYRLAISYGRGVGGGPDDDLLAEVWMLVDLRRERDRLAAAALQRYARGWRAWADLRAEPLADGLALLMQHLTVRRDRE